MASNDFFDAFLSPAASGPTLKGVLELLPRVQIDAWPEQPRAQKRSASEIATISASIRDGFARGAGLGATGIEQPLTVRPHPDAKQRAAGRFILVDGEGRFLATAPSEENSSALPTLLPCLVRDLSEEAAWEVASIGGIARQEYAPLDEAGIVRALQEGKNAEKRALSVREVAAKLGKDRGWVQNRVALAKLREKSITNSDLEPLLNLLSLRNDSLSHVLILAEIAPGKMRDALCTATENGASVAQIRDCLAALQKQISSEIPDEVFALIPDARALENRLSLRNDSSISGQKPAHSGSKNGLSLRNDSPKNEKQIGANASAESVETLLLLATRHTALALKKLRDAPGNGETNGLDILEKRVLELQKQVMRLRKAAGDVK